MSVGTLCAFYIGSRTVVFKTIQNNVVFCYFHTFLRFQVVALFALSALIQTRIFLAIEEHSMWRLHTILVFEKKTRFAFNALIVDSFLTVRNRLMSAVDATPKLFLRHLQFRQIRRQITTITTPDKIHKIPKSPVQIKNETVSTFKTLNISILVAIGQTGVFYTSVSIQPRNKTFFAPQAAVARIQNALVDLGNGFFTVEDLVNEVNSNPVKAFFAHVAGVQRKVQHAVRQFLVCWDRDTLASGEVSEVVFFADLAFVFWGEHVAVTES